MQENFKTCLLYLLSFLCLVLVGNFAFSYCFIGSDFYQDYLAGVALLKGKSIYGSDIINLGIELLGTNKNDNFHPPFVAIFMTFFAIFPYEYAAMLQQSITLILYMLIIYHAFNHYKILNYKYYLPLLLIWHPLIAHFGLVQISIYVCYFLFLGYLFYKKGSHKLSALFFALASSIKLYPLFMIFFLYKVRAKKNIIYYLSFLVLINLVTALIVGFKDYSYYFTSRISYNSFQSGEAPFNFSLYSSLMYVFEKTKWSTPLVSFEHWKIIYYFIGALGVLPFILDRNDEKSEENLFHLAILSMLIFSPILWSHMLLIIVPVIIYMFKNYKTEKTLILIAVFILSLPLMPINNYVISKYVAGGIPWYQLFVLKLPLFALLLLWILLFRSKKVSLA